MAAGGAGRRESGTPLSIVTFNMLAPCYFRAPPPADMEGDTPISVCSVAGGGGGGGSDADIAMTSHAGDGLGRARHSSSATPGLAVEATLPPAWGKRVAQQLALLAELAPDVIALQELWCVPAVIALVRSTLGASYAFHVARRTGRKEDGVALLVRKATWVAVGEHTEALAGAGDRVLLLVALEPAGEAHSGGGGGGGGIGWGAPVPAAAAAAAPVAGRGKGRGVPSAPAPPPSSADVALASLLASTRAALGGGGGGRGSSGIEAAPVAAKRRVVVATTHLTFPHNDYDLRLRKTQATTAVRAIDAFAAEVGAAAAVSSVVHQLHSASAVVAVSGDGMEVEAEAELAVPVVFAGDFNHSCDAALDVIHAAGFLSAHALTHDGCEPDATHVDHHGAAVCVDYVFVRTSHVSPPALDAGLLAAVAADVLPVGAPVARGDRPEFAHFAARDGPPAPLAAMTPPDWQALSDHRPLLAHFRVWP
mgnify:CR=1 FL=1